MTDEEIAKKLALAIGNEMYRQYQDNPRWSEAKDVIEDFVAEDVAKVALSIAKPLIAKDAREMALQQAMIAVQGVINGIGSGPIVSIIVHDYLVEAKAAIFALSNNPEVGE